MDYNKFVYGGFYNAGHGIICVNQNKEIVEINKVGKEILEFESEDIIGKHIDNIIKIYTPNGTININNIFNEVLEKGCTKGLREYSMINTKNRSKVYISASISPIISNEKIIGVVMIFRDINKFMKKEEDIIRKNNQLNMYKAVLEEASDIIVFLNINGKIVEVNKAAEIAYGYNKMELIGSNVDVIKADNYMNLGVIRKVEEEGEFFFNSLHKSKVGKVFPVEISAKLIYLSGEKHIVAIIKDITEREEYEKKLLNEKINSEKASKAKSDFLANMSHEIRTPISGILGMTEILLNSKLSEEDNINLNIIKMSANNLLNTVNEILDFSRIEARKVIIEKNTFNFKLLINKLIKTYENEAIKKDIKFDYLYDDRIPDILIGDENKIIQVLNNIVFNAIKFTDRGKIQVIIKKIEEEKGNIKLSFKIIDTGIGIPKEKLDDLFTPFSQVESEFNKKRGGTGLGLSISKKIIDLMGGDIKVDSVLNKGSTFLFSICLIKKMGEDSLKQPKEETYKYIYNKKILLAEDFAVNQRMAMKFLENFDVDLDIASNGLEALNKVKKNNYDVILMDIQMPIMDGIKATNEIRKYEKLIKHRNIIIAVTAYALKEDRDKILKNDIDDYLSKPYNSNELINIIEKNLMLKSKKDNEELNKKEGSYIKLGNEEKNIDVFEMLKVKKESNLEKLTSNEYDWLRKKVLELERNLLSLELNNVEKVSNDIKTFSDKKDLYSINKNTFKLMLYIRKSDMKNSINYFEELKKEILKGDEVYEKNINS